MKRRKKKGGSTRDPPTFVPRPPPTSTRCRQGSRNQFPVATEGRGSNPPNRAGGWVARLIIKRERGSRTQFFFFCRNTKKAINSTINEISTQKLHHFKGKKSYNFLSKHENVKIDKLCKNNRDASPQGGIKSKDWARWSYTT